MYACLRGDWYRLVLPCRPQSLAQSDQRLALARAHCAREARLGCNVGSRQARGAVGNRPRGVHGGWQLASVGVLHEEEGEEGVDGRAVLGHGEGRTVALGKLEAVGQEETNVE